MNWRIRSNRLKPAWVSPMKTEMGGNMTAQIIDEFLVLGKFRLLALDHDIDEGSYSKYRIAGVDYEPVLLNMRPSTGTNPMNYIAIKTTKSFKDEIVELI